MEDAWIDVLKIYDFKKIQQRTIKIVEKDYYDEMSMRNKDDIVKNWKLICNIMNNKRHFESANLRRA